jgi:putative copper export protein
VVVAETTAIPLRAAMSTEVGWRGATDGEALVFVLAGPVGASCLLRIAGALLILAMLAGGYSFRSSLRRAGRSVVSRLAVTELTARRGGAAVGAVVSLASFVVIGHAQATSPRALWMLADITHVVAASVWFGGVTMLAMMLRDLRRLRRGRDLYRVDERVARARAVLAVAVGRFSVAATACVAAVTAAGVGLAFSQLPAVAALYETSYGVTLVGKLILVGFVMLLGGYNHRFVVPRVVTDPSDERAWRQLRQAVQVETVIIAFGILVASAALAAGGFGALAR